VLEWNGVLLWSEGGFELGRRDRTNGLQEPAMVEPVDPFQGGVLDLVDALPGASPADQLGLVQPDDRLGQGVVVAVAAGTDRGDRAGVGEPFGVADGQVAGRLRRASPGLPTRVGAAGWCAITSGSGSCPR
jgi:hypothetical protein